MDTPFEPMIGYDFNKQGMYRAGEHLTTEAAFSAWMLKHTGPALREGRRLVVTDMGDHAVFVIDKYKVEFAGGYDVDKLTKHLAMGVGRAL